MTTINKPVSRRTRGSYSTLYVKPRPIVVTICPGDVLELREHGRRKRWIIAVDTVFRYAVRLSSLHESAEKKRGKR